MQGLHRGAATLARAISPGKQIRSEDGPGLFPEPKIAPGLKLLPVMPRRHGRHATDKQEAAIENCMEQRTAGGSVH